MRILIIEDGHEYHELFSRFLPRDQWIRVGSGPAALDWLGREVADAIFLDMRFDRAPPAELLGDLDQAAERFNGDPVQARAFLEDHQGHFILAALRQRGVALPVLLAADLSEEPRRWARLAARYAPLDGLPEGAGPDEARSLLQAMVGGHPEGGDRGP
ncbi:MAG: hypothetical protein JXX28_07380 [Deltaproteobacteria bacterium]|nr:hypothetical protein [Deltaproteobacteria bacterium]